MKGKPEANQSKPTESKRPELTDERFANWCMDTCEDQKDKYLAFSVEQSKWIDTLEGRLLAIKQHYEKMPKENQSIYWTSTCGDEIQDEFIGQKFFSDLQKWFVELGVLLQPDPFTEKAQPKNDKFRCDEFGNPNMSDACCQCPSNHECCEKWRELDQKTEDNKK